MTANELRIGNYVTDGLFQYSVVGINFDESIWGSIDKVVNHKKAETEDYYKLGDYHLSIENVQPIPLTEEWLVKFKWQLVRGGNYYINSYFSLSSKCLYYCNDFTGVTIESVHQLQNLYIALTGEELTLKSES
jgi:hypothetical protein